MRTIVLLLAIHCAAKTVHNFVNNYPGKFLYQPECGNAMVRQKRVLNGRKLPYGSQP